MLTPLVVLRELGGGSRFSTRRVLGSGAASGVVYEALDSLTGQRVALKELGLRDEAAAELLRADFHVLSLLSHPNLARLLDLVEIGGVFLVATELVEGGDSLSSVRGPVLRNALVQIARGLVALHAAGRIHGNLKPSNVRMSARGGRVVLLDAGSLGSPLPTYAAPEQLETQSPPGPAADWYALGAMLHEALTGRLPFSGPAARVLEQKRSSPPPPLRSLPPGMPADLAALCVELLQTSPSFRPSGEEVLKRLEAMLHAPGPDNTPGQPERRLEQRPARPSVPVPSFSLPPQPQADLGPPPGFVPPTPEEELGPEVREFRGTQRFRVQRQVGSGGMGMVYSVQDRERDEEVALKTLRQLSPHGLYLFKNEFRALADLRHENLVSFHELFCDEGLWFFTMELLNGEDLLAHVRAGWPPPRFDEARLRAALPQLVRGLMALHAAGKIHRDVKPSNVMVTTTGRVVLMDFGLAVDAVEASEESLIGTPHYMAPEQITGQNVGPPADYYALGVVLYQLLTGRFPFEGAYSELLELKRTREPVPPARLSTRVPEDLSRLTADLLRMDPEARPVGAQLLQRLGAPPPPPGKEPTPSPAARSSEVHFVGRQSELEALDRAFQAVRKGTARGVLVHGESGVGKSALVRHFVEGLRDEGRAMVLSGRCYEQESVPYKAFDGVMDALSRELLHLDEMTARSVLPGDAALVARLFPVLQRVPAMQAMHPSRPPPVDPFELRTESFAALRTMLRHLGRLRPAVLFVDDLQWADQDSLALLSELLSPPSPPPFLLVATLRGNAEDIRSADGVLAPLAWVTESLQELQLLPLPEPDALQLAQRLEPDQERARELVRESGGHPLYLIELGNRQGRPPASGEPETLEAGEAPKAGLDELLYRRAQALPGEARHLLSLVALAGGPVQQALLARASGLSASEMATHVAELRRADLVRTLGLSEKAPIEPYHDRVRESVRHWLPGDASRRYHRELATALEGNTDGSFASLRMLVTHLAEGGAPERAGQHAANAADLAVEALAFEQAAELYEQALRLSPSRPAPERQELRVRLARALDYAAKGAAAARAYLEAAQGASGPERREFRRKAAELLLASGHVDEGLSAVDGVLEEIGARLPATRRGAVASLAWQRLQLQLRGLSYQRRPALDVPRETLDRIDTCYAVQTGLSGVDSVRGFAFQTRGFRLALNAGEETRIGRGMAVEGFNVATAGAASRKQALDLISRARAIGEALKDPYLCSLATLARGMALYLTGQFGDGARLIAEGEQLQKETVRQSNASVAKELSTARLLRLQALRMTGELQEMERSTLEYVKEAVTRGDLFGEVSFLRGAAFRHLAADAPDRALEDLTAKELPVPRGSFHNQHWYSLRLRAEVALYGAEPTARAFLAEEFQAFRRSALPDLQVARVEADWLWARLHLLEAFVPHVRAPALREVRRSIRALESEKVAYASGLALLLRACHDSVEGDRPSAGRLLAQARDALKGSLGLCAAVAAYRLGQMSGGGQLDESEARLRELGVRRPARMADVVAPGAFG